MIDYLAYKQGNRRLGEATLRSASSKAAPYPWELIVEPTNTCNLSCSICATGNGTLGRSPAFMDFEAYRGLMAEVGPALQLLSLFNYGEPLLHPELPDMIQEAKHYQVVTQISTNGHRLAHRAQELVLADLDRVIVSLDGITPEALGAYRGPRANPQLVIEGLREILDVRRQLRRDNPEVILQFIVMRPNQHEISKVRVLANELGVDRLFYKSLVVDLERPETFDLLPDEKYWGRYERACNGSIRLKGKPPMQCSFIYRSPAILVDGTMVACCYDAWGELPFGNVFQDGLSTVWNGETMQAFRRDFAHRRHKLRMCQLCSEGRLDSLALSPEE
jgi:MoaA/NifB/PqqE/SkfB family radical SAM enzyme